jgi:hypothetical protein
MWIGNDVWEKSLSLLRSWRLLFEREGAPTEADGGKGGFAPVEFIFNLIAERLYVFDHYSSIPIFHDLEVNIIRRQRKKKEKVHACYSGRKAVFFTYGRRYRMISPFLFFKKTCETAILCPDGGYAGRSEDGACLRL